MAEQVNAKFTSDSSELSSTTLSGGSAAVEWASAAGLGGQTGGLKITLTGATQAFGRIGFTAWSGNTAGRSRFYIDPASMTMGDNEKFDCWRLLDVGVNPLAVVRLGYTTANGYFLELRSIRDSGADDTLTSVNITDAEHWVEVHIVKESSDGADDGKYYWYIDSLSATVAEHLTVDNFNTFAGCDEVNIGLITGRDAGTSGFFYGDEIVVRNDATAIGSTNSAPVLTVPGAQTCTLGTQKSVTGISVADTDSNLSTIRVQVTGSATCTVTLSGCTVSAGTNGTNDFTITGTQANLNTAIGTLKTDLAQVAWTDGTSAPPAGHIDATTTITVTATDSGSLSDSETITCNWTLPTGNGTKSLLLSESTLSALNTALAAVQYTPVEAFTGTTYLHLKLTDGNAATDAVTMPISVATAIAAADIFTNTGIASVRRTHDVRDRRREFVRRRH